MQVDKDRTDEEREGRSDRKTIGFWSRELKAGRLLTAIRSHPKEARRFFGALPAMRENITELALILDARKTLKNVRCEPLQRYGRVYFRAAKI